MTSRQNIWSEINLISPSVLERVYLFYWRKKRKCLQRELKNSIFGNKNKYIMRKVIACNRTLLVSVFLQAMLHFCSHFWRKLNFWAPKTPLLDAHGARTRYEVLRPSLFSAHCTSFMLKWPLLRRGEVNISSVGTGPIYKYTHIALYTIDIYSIQDCRNKISIQVQSAIQISALTWKKTLSPNIVVIESFIP